MLDFLYTVVSWVLLQWHHLFTVVGIDKDSGTNWALSIVFLVITARVLLFRVFIRQVKYQRRMQELQPKLQEIRNKYKNDKAEQQRQMMKFQQEEGFNPVTGCLPMFLQFPIFIALFHVLRHISNSITAAEAFRGNGNSTAHLSTEVIRQLSLYGFTPSETASAAQANLFGAPLAGSLHDTAARIAQLGGDVTSTRAVTLVLVIVSAGATFFTQILARRAMTVQPEGSAATIQRLMLVGIPLSVLFSGLFFPLGVLLYWFTSNTWTMFQQMYINRFHPHDDPKTETADTVSLGKSLAPKPGAKPQRRPSDAAGAAASTTSGDSTDEEGGASTATDPATPVAGTKPKPGARAGGKSGQRPANRPNQSRKRR